MNKKCTIILLSVFIFTLTVTTHSTKADSGATGGYQGKSVDDNPPSDKATGGYQGK